LTTPEFGAHTLRQFGDVVFPVCLAESLRTLRLSGEYS